MRSPQAAAILLLFLCWSRPPEGLVCDAGFPLCSTSGRNMGLPWRRCRGQGPHPVKMLEPHRFSRVASGFSNYDGDFRLPLGLALGSPVFPWSCEGKLGVLLESLQGNEGFPPPPEKDLESPSSTRLEALVPSRDSRARNSRGRLGFPGPTQEEA